MTEIVNHAFYGCKKLTSITLPDSVKQLGVYAFHDCLALESVKLSASLTELGDRSFDGCMALQALEIPASVEKLGVAVLASVKLEKIHYAGTVEQWNAVEKNTNWFALTEITEVICSDGTVTIERASEE